jgi:hypothetical protein
LAADLAGNTHRPTGDCVDRTPKCARSGENLVIRFTSDFRKPLEGDAGRFANPGPQFHPIVLKGRLLIFDFVSQHDPLYFSLGLGRGESAPMGHCDILNPAQINGIVDMILPIDVFRLDTNGQFKEGGDGGHWRLGEDRGEARASNSRRLIAEGVCGAKNKNSE